MKNRIKASIALLSTLVPAVSSAQFLRGTTGLAQSGYNLLRTILIPMVFSLALLYFFYGVAKYIKSDAGSGKEEGRQIMIWGVVALFVMSTVWGLVYFLRGELGIFDSQVPVVIPSIQQSN